MTAAPGMSRKTHRIIAWLCVATWAAVVWGLGSDSLSAAQTSRFLRPMLEYFFPDLTVVQLYQILVGIRKSAHVFEYGLLAILTLRALLLGRRPSILACAGLAMAFIVTFASADETRQGLSAARSGSSFDVLIDSLGGASAIGLLLYLHFRRPIPLFTGREPGEVAAPRNGEA